MEIKGKVIARMEARGGISSRGTEWKSQQYVIEHGEDAEHLKHAVIEFGPDPEKVENAAKYLRKDSVATFHLDIDAREYQGRWYNSVRCWKFDLEKDEPKEITPSPKQEVAAAPKPATNEGVGNNEVAQDENDLPF